VRQLVVLVALLVLTACGADGPPERPERSEGTELVPGITLKGSIGFGVTGGTNRLK